MIVCVKAGNKTHFDTKLARHTISGCGGSCGFQQCDSAIWWQLTRMVESSTDSYSEYLIKMADLLNRMFGDAENG